MKSNINGFSETGGNWAEPLCPTFVMTGSGVRIPLAAPFILLKILRKFCAIWLLQHAAVCWENPGRTARFEAVWWHLV